MPTEAPAAPAAPAAPPPPTTTIRVDATGGMTANTGPVSDKGPAPEAPKKGTARSRLSDELAKRAQPTHSPDRPATPTKKEPGAGATPARPEPPPESAEETQEAANASPPPEAAPAEKPIDKKKTNPWKLLDEYKKRGAELEAQLAETKKAVLDPKEKETLASKLAEFEKRNQELEQEIRFTNYAKSREYQDKYERPYEEAWKKAMSELGELTIQTESGQERPLSPQDMLVLVNLPLKQAREQAESLFGGFADDVMAHRKEIKNLFEAQQKALEDARKTGTERDKARQEQAQKVYGEIDKSVAQAWTQSHEALMKDEKNAPFFKPVEGDEEGNKRLAHGYDLAQRAFAQNPKDPRLSPEQRAQIVQEHLAIFHRAAAAGRLLYWLQQERDAHKATRAELDKYRSSEPGQGKGAAPSEPVNPGRASDSVFGALRQLAH